jgi:hypothetical protein
VELRFPVERVEPDLPGRGVNQGVVRPAEEDEVVERRVAAVGPVGQVVGVAGERLARAAGEPARVLLDRAAQWRAPWSRVSRPTSPGSVPGSGAARAWRAVLMRAASSTVDSRDADLGVLR